MQNFNWNIENCLKYNFIKLSFNWHVKSSPIYTPNAYEIIYNGRVVTIAPNLYRELSVLLSLTPISVNA